MKPLLLTLLLLLASPGLQAAKPPMLAAEPPPTFQSAAEEQRYRSLVSELRCVMCQNQSLADSNAMIAHDLRKEVLQLMRDGRSDDQIKQFLVVRYTDFVLYKPEIKPMTWLLWFGPGALVLIGAVVIAVIVRRRSAAAPVAPPAEDSQEW
ncbi:MAG TPA: cytochrome c-type biogenesis protein [Arenimonas sp.]|uniref:cytochrome c-type biogenesis protein n=1 Tax=Arenimonas sp. TaxID=1872635 RepID=UPI002C0DA43B|nr:cytochrome c-type biogenesis protein [Arenimonas sp.]HMB56641.1 cytochrome c-type biogenesis protein [Arenimonas sp.]